mmetsp:Transcript_82866/g.208777  ORF Transcript_82866/g.208777 Transcript_82866/m.208777 type:complete len:217 (+) Transcript_82866:652-1302(+)
MGIRIFWHVHGRQGAELEDAVCRDMLMQPLVQVEVAGNKNAPEVLLNDLLILCCHGWVCESGGLPHVACFGDGGQRWRSATPKQDGHGSETKFPAQQGNRPPVLAHVPKCSSRIGDRKHADNGPTLRQLANSKVDRVNVALLEGGMRALADSRPCPVRRCEAQPTSAARVVEESVRTSCLQVDSDLIEQWREVKAAGELCRAACVATRAHVVQAVW